ncbi:hypothetical protein [Aquamicrobium sp. LC103]|uniref:hypothetical protein n=1 Tax=Aquamicrobium sp. LC103 TaxID=1120658 RepID=UPI000AF56221|nr:hypothetical protein [Aquamicrobium sp. LC103]
MFYKAVLPAIGLAMLVLSGCNSSQPASGAPEPGTFEAPPPPSTIQEPGDPAAVVN